MEETVFHRAAVAAQLENYTEARLHSDHGDRALRNRWKALSQELANTLANPTFVIVDPRDDEKLAVFAEAGRAVLNDEPFIAFLAEAWAESRTRKVAQGK